MIAYARVNGVASTLSEAKEIVASDLAGRMRSLETILRALKRIASRLDDRRMRQRSCNTSDV